MTTTTEKTMDVCNILPMEVKYKVFAEAKGRGQTYGYVKFDSETSTALKSSEHLRQFLTNFVEGLNWHKVYSEYAAQDERKRLVSEGKVAEAKGYYRSVYVLRKYRDTLESEVSQCFRKYRELFLSSPSDNLDPDDDDLDDETEEALPSFLSSDESSDDIPAWVLSTDTMTIAKIKENLNALIDNEELTTAILDRVVENESSHTKKDGTPHVRTSLLTDIEKDFRSQVNGAVEECEAVTTTLEEDNVPTTPFYNPDEFSPKQLVTWLEGQNGKHKPSDLSQMKQVWIDKGISPKVIDRIGLVKAAEKPQTATKFVTPVPVQQTSTSADPTMTEVLKALSALTELVASMQK